MPRHSPFSLLLLVALLVVLPSPAPLAQQTLSTAAGGGPEDLLATGATMPRPTTVIAAPAGELLVAIFSPGRVFRVDAQGVVHGVAGLSGACPSAPYGDGLPAARACFDRPAGLALDKAGNIYISDTMHHAVRRVDAVTGLITRFAGNYFSSYGGDGGPASSALLNRPHGLAFDASGNLYIADRENHRVRRVAAGTSIITTVIGTGFATGSIDGPAGDPRDNLGDGGTALLASLNSPHGIAIDPAGNIYVGDRLNHRVRRIEAATGIITTVAGDGTAEWTADDVVATASGLAGPAHVALDPAGNLFIADSREVPFPTPETEEQNHRVRRVDAATGIISTVSGGEGRGFGGDGGPAGMALLYHPTGVAIDSRGDLVIADRFNDRIRRVSADTGIITTTAGNGLAYCGDGFPARRAVLHAGDIESNAAGDLYMVDWAGNRVRRLDALSGLIATYAGNGSSVTSGDGGPAVAAGFEGAFGLGLDATGNLYVTDAVAGRVRRVNHATGIITTVAGSGYGYAGDGGSALNALFGAPEDVAIAANGDLYIADTENQRIRRVRGGTVITVAGTGVPTGSIDGPGGDPTDDLGDGGPARDASLNFPGSIHFDPGGRLIIVDSVNHRVRRFDLSAGTITTVAGDGLARFAGDGGPATAGSLKNPKDAVSDAGGDLFISDHSNNRLRLVDATSGFISTASGDGTQVFAPDGSPASGAPLNGPEYLALDGAGRLYVSTSSSQRVRVLLSEPPPSGSVPDGSDPAGRPLDVTRASGGNITLSWGASCTGSDLDYVVYEGTLGDYSSHSPRLCSTGGATAVTLTPAAGNLYYLVAPRNGLREGSFGSRSDGVARPEGTASCLPRLAGASCG